MDYDANNFPYMEWTYDTFQNSYILIIKHPRLTQLIPAEIRYSPGKFMIEFEENPGVRPTRVIARSIDESPQEVESQVYEVPLLPEDEAYI